MTKLGCKPGSNWAGRGNRSSTPCTAVHGGCETEIELPPSAPALAVIARSLAKEASLVNHHDEWELAGPLRRAEAGIQGADSGEDSPGLPELFPEMAPLKTFQSVLSPKA